MSLHARRRLVALLALAVVAVGVVLAVRAVQDVARGYDPRGATVSHAELRSEAVADRTLKQTYVAPPGGAQGRPLLVFLHGRGEDGADSNLSDELFAALAQLGDRAPAIVFPDGGEASYWHDRDDGAWARYVLDEAIPAAVRRLHADPRRIAIGGISMGGFGAYDLARLAPGRFCAVGGHSAAIWEQAGDSAAGAFDDADDFAAHDLIATAQADAAPWRGIPLWLDGGDADPFRAGDDAFASALRAGGASGHAQDLAGRARGRLLARPHGRLPALLRAGARALPAREVDRDEVLQLAAAVEEALQRLAGRAVRQRQLDLGDAVAGADGVDRHPDLHPEARRERHDRRQQVGPQRALAGDRRDRLQPAAPLDRPVREADREPEAAADAAREGGDGEVGVAALDGRDELLEGARARRQVAVAEQHDRRVGLVLRERAAGAGPRASRRRPCRR